MKAPKTHILLIAAVLLAAACSGETTSSPGPGGAGTDGGGAADSNTTTGDTASTDAGGAVDTTTAPDTTTAADTTTTAADTGASAATDTAANDSATSANDAAAVDATAGDTATTAAPTMAEVHAKVISQYSCSSGYCHGPVMGPSKSQSTPELMKKLHTALLAGNSKEATCGTKKWVVAGQPMDSLLYRKIAPGVSTNGCGKKMPPSGADGVTAEQAAIVKAWILGGAKP